MIVDRIYQYYERQREVEPTRFHLGASQLGADCERSVWLGYRWFDRENIEGRILRLFDTGKREEFRLLDELAAIGVKVQLIADNPDLQHKVSAYGGHFGGSMDAIATHIDPENPETPYVLEFKTHNAKSFSELQKHGLDKAKWQHFVQMQIYMGLTGIHQGLYLGVCKDNDNIYEELVRFDTDVFTELMEKARRLLQAATPPVKLHNSPQFFKCKWCPMLEVCHNGKKAAKSCRTCIHSAPHKSGQWHCSKRDILLDNQQQQAGCDEYTAIQL
jgi:hypothetical protein